MRWPTRTPTTSWSGGTAYRRRCCRSGPPPTKTWAHPTYSSACSSTSVRPWPKATTTPGRPRRGPTPTRLNQRACLQAALRRSRPAPRPTATTATARGRPGPRVPRAVTRRPPPPVAATPTRRRPPRPGRRRSPRARSDAPRRGMRHECT